MALNFWIDIADFNGNVQGSGPITNATKWTQTHRLDRAGEFSFRMPHDTVQIQPVASKGWAYCKTIINGNVTTLGAGIIDKWEEIVDEEGEWFQVSGPDLVGDLKRANVKNLTLQTKSGPLAVLNQYAATIQGSIKEPDEVWGLFGNIQTATELSLKMSYETVLNALVSIAAKTGEHFQPVIGQKKLNWLGGHENFADSGIVATANAEGIVGQNVALINKLTRRVQSHDVFNRVYVFGAGEGENRLSLRAATNGLVTGTDGWIYDHDNSFIEGVFSQITYGLHETAISFKDIRPLSNNDADMEAASNMLLEAGFQWMRKRAYASDTYDIEMTMPGNQLAPGTTMLVDARRWRDGTRLITIENERFNVLEVRTTIDSAGIRTSGATVSTIDSWPETDEEFVVNRINQSIVMESHPQLGPSIDTISYSSLLDTDNDARFRFWLGDETTTVNQVLMRFRVDPLRSSVKSVGGESTSTDSSTGLSSASSSSSTSQAGSSHTHVVPDHDHDILVTNSLSTAEAVGIASGGSSPTVFTHGGTQDVLVPTEPDSGQVTSNSEGAHTHGISHTHDIDHTHGVTANVQTVYGIFEESSSNTLIATEMSFEINNGATTNTIQQESGGWWSLDLTPDLTNDYSRPLREENVVTISTTVDKTATITALIERRTVIQSVATF